MRTYDFEQSIGYWVTVAALSFHRQLNEQMAPFGVTFRQSQVIGWLVLEGMLSQNELAARMQIEPPTLAGILDRMEKAGWIARVECPSDRRKKLIVLQPAVEPVWSQIIDCALRVRARAMEGLSEDEIATLRTMLQKINDNLNNSPEAALAEVAGDALPER